MATKTKGMKKGDRVVATVDLPGVPEGTTGKIKLVNGMGPWIRGWVQFDNGVWMGSVSSTDLVKAAEWEDYKVRRAEEAEAAKNRVSEVASDVAAAPAEAPAAADAGAAPSAAQSKVPAHLLERAKAARERKAAAAAAGE